MYVLVTCKYEKDPIINSQENSESPISPFKSMGNFSDAQGQLNRCYKSSLILPNFQLIQAFMYVIVTCKYQKDPIKNS